MYRAPVEEIAHTLKIVAGLDDAIAQGRLGYLSDDLVDAILEEAGKFASTRVAPLLQIGDEPAGRKFTGNGFPVAGIP